MIECLNVEFRRPKIERKKVIFEWEACFLDEYFREGRNYASIEYHSEVKLNLSICYTQLIGQFFPIISGLKPNNKINVCFPDPVKKSDIDVWTRLKNIENVRVVSKIHDDKKSALPQISINGEKKIGLLYGGGKDSLAALKLFNDLYPDAKKSILRIHWSKQSIGRQKALFTKKIMEPLRKDFEIEYLDCTNDIYRNMKKREFAQLMGFAFYHASCLPYYLSNNFLYVNFSIDSLDFPTSEGSAKNKKSIRFASARPEKSLHMTEFMKKRGFSTKIRNVSFGIPGYLHFELLAKGERKYLKHIYMCENTFKRWCFNCRKCLSLALLALRYEYDPKPAEFDLREFFENGEYINNKVKPELEIGNQGYSKIYTHTKHHAATAQVLKLIDENYAKAQLSDSGFEVIRKLKKRFEECADENSMAIWQEAVHVECRTEFELMINYFKSLNLPIVKDKCIRLLNNTADVYDFTFYSD